MSVSMVKDMRAVCGTLYAHELPVKVHELFNVTYCTYVRTEHI